MKKTPNGYGCAHMGNPDQVITGKGLLTAAIAAAHSGLITPIIRTIRDCPSNSWQFSTLYFTCPSVQLGSKKMHRKHNNWGFWILWAALIMLAMLGMWKLMEVTVFSAPLVCLR